MASNPKKDSTADPQTTATEENANTDDKTDDNNDTTAPMQTDDQ